MSDEVCIRCGYPRGEHHYMGACYGICGDFTDYDLAEFKPGYIINEPLNMIEVHFEDVAHKSVPLIDGVYHWIDKLVAFDDGRVVGLNVWIYKPPKEG